MISVGVSETTCVFKVFDGEKSIGMPYHCPAILYLRKVSSVGDGHQQDESSEQENEITGLRKRHGMNVQLLVAVQTRPPQRHLPAGKD